MIKIEIENHVGIANTELGPVEVKLNQWRIFATNEETGKRMHVGYLGKQDGAPFNGTLQMGELPQSLQDTIVAEIEKQIGRSLRTSIPPDYRQAEEDEADDEDTDTMDEEVDE